MLINFDNSVMFSFKFYVELYIHRHVQSTYTHMNSNDLQQNTVFLPPTGPHHINKTLHQHCLVKQKYWHRYILCPCSKALTITKHSNTQRIELFVELKVGCQLCSHDMLIRCSLEICQRYCIHMKHIHADVYRQPCQFIFVLY